MLNELQEESDEHQRITPYEIHCLDSYPDSPRLLNSTMLR